MFRVIVGMSTELKNVKDSIRDASYRLDEHLIKLALFSDCDSKEHWRAEVYSYLHIVPKLKGSNKFPKASLIQNELSTYEDMIDRMISVVKRNYKNLRPCNISNYEIADKISKYHVWISNELSKYGDIPAEDVFDKLDELGL